VIQSQTDKVVLLYHDDVPSEDPDWQPEVLDYFSEWHANMSTALAPIISDSSADGAFHVASVWKSSKRVLARVQDDASSTRVEKT